MLLETAQVDGTQAAGKLTRPERSLGFSDAGRVLVLHNDPVAQNLRECAFAQWRAVRARVLAKPTARATLNARLEPAIRKDYMYAHHVDTYLEARRRPYLRIGDDTRRPPTASLPSRTATPIITSLDPIGLYGCAFL
jgi:hypothetical protein